MASSAAKGGGKEHPQIIAVNDQVDGSAEQEGKALMARVLMKEGHWLVPAAERPRGWESMELVEPESNPAPKPRQQRTVTAAQSEHTVERHVTSSVTITEDVPVDPVPLIEVKAELEVPKAPLMSHVPLDPPELKEFLECAIDIYGRNEPIGDEDENWWCEGIERTLPTLGERIHAYRQAKVLTDTLLTDWITRNAAQLRHIGVGSKPIQDLWSTVLQLMWDKRLLEREATNLCKMKHPPSGTQFNDMRRLLGLPEEWPKDGAAS